MVYASARCQLPAVTTPKQSIKGAQMLPANAMMHAPVIRRQVSCVLIRCRVKPTASESLPAPRARAWCAACCVRLDDWCDKSVHRFKIFDILPYLPPSSRVLANIVAPPNAHANSTFTFPQCCHADLGLEHIHRGLSS
ncbi:hypothetical protein MRB53_037158 [Persea americana]|nr:hypothetical protein MRB53_037158 [Persea americana]